MEITKEAFKSYSEKVGTNKVDALLETHEDVKRDIDTKLVFVAITEEATVGVVRVAVKADNTAYLSRFAVRADKQKMGIGKHLMNTVDKTMIKKGVTKISLHTGLEITSLMNFYSDKGFEIESTDNERGYVRALLVKRYDK